jgi:hypothetical protein
MIYNIIMSNVNLHTRFSYRLMRCVLSGFSYQQLKKRKKKGVIHLKHDTSTGVKLMLKKSSVKISSMEFLFSFALCVVCTILVGYCFGVWFYKASFIKRKKEDQ